MNCLGASTIYVSQRFGNALNLGIYSSNDEFCRGPVDSIETALERVFQLRVSGSLRPMNVCLLDDEYFLTKTLSLECEKILPRFKNNECLSGITFTSFGNRRCKIIGGRRITGFKADTFNGKECLSAFIPEVKENGVFFTDLYVDGDRAAVTRYPQSGTLRCVDTESGDVGTGWDKAHTHSKWFIAHKEDLAGLSNLENATVNYFHYWVDEHSPIESYDRESGKLTMKYKSRFLMSNRYHEEFTGNLEYYLENVPERFENPGEWYLDRKSGMLYYLPKIGQTADNISVLAPTLGVLADISGTSEERVKNIRFKNIDFMCSTSEYESTKTTAGVPEDDGPFASDSQSVVNAHGAININFAQNCSFENCSFTNLGVHAVTINQGCDGIKIDNCKFFDIGAGGVKIFGTRDADAQNSTHHNTVSNCEISHCGRRYAAGCGILVCNASCNEISDNTIHGINYSGVSVGWTWGYSDGDSHDNIIKKNHIYNIGDGRLSDMGGIYLLGRQKGTVVTGNVIHDVFCRHYGGWGIYTDEGSCFVTVENNIVYRTKSGCFHQHYGCDVVVRNNIFAFGGDYILIYSMQELHPALLVEKNIFVTDGKPLISATNEGVGAFFGLVSHDNLIYDVSGREPCVFVAQNRKIGLAEAQKLGFELGSIVADPLLDDNFRLADNSPAFDMGFEAIRNS